MSKLLRLAGFGVALLFLVLTVQSAAAHAVPVESEPRPNQILEVSPTEVLIEFNEPVVPTLSQIRLLSQAGERVETTLVEPVDAENTTLRILIPEPLKDGAYLVSWQVLSSVDGHTTAGTFSFGVGDTELTAVSDDVTVSAQLSILSATARWVFLLGIILIMGLFVFRLIVWNPIFDDVELEPEEEALDMATAKMGVRLANVGVFLLFVALILIFVDQNSTYSLIEINNLSIWLGTQFGRVWLIRFFLVALTHFNLSTFINLTDDRYELRGWEWWTGLILAFGLTLTNALVSHSAASTEMTLQAILIDWAHVLAATIWIGGLFYLVIAFWQSRQLKAEIKSWLSLSLILNFSALAAICVGILTASGVYLAWRHIGSWTLLVGTAYGLALVYKILLSLVVGLLAWINLMFLKPRLSRLYDDALFEESAKLINRFNNVIRFELLIAVAIIVLAGFITDLQRGADAPLLSDAPGQTTITAVIDELDYTLEIKPALIGENEFEIEILEPNGEPIPEDAEVGVRYTFLGQSVGAADTMAERVGDGRYVVNGSYISLIGNWQVEISVRRPGVYDSFAPFRLEAGIGGNIRPLDEGLNPLEDFAKLMTLLGSGGSGLAMILFAILWGYIATRASRAEWQLIPMLAVSLIAFWFGTTHIINFFDVEYTPAKFATNPILPDAASIAIGQELYTENCVPCHGVEGRADGPAAINLNPPPVDFTDGHTATHTDGDLFFWILQGKEDTAMPAFEDRISREEAWHLVNYIRRLSSLGASSNSFGDS
ncbi:MAG: copper resistance protein CopC [Chloroflexota bacterium]